MTKIASPDPLAATAEGLSLGERAAIGRIEKALFGGDQLVRLGRYEIGALIGSGSFGKVYRARDPELDRDVALKVTEAMLGEADRDDLLREARVMATIGHPNVAPVYDAGVIAEGARLRVFLAMELVSGGNLRDWLAREPRSHRAILDVLIAAGRGLAAAHATGVVHRDFKPDNVLVGDDRRARVVDFGLSRARVGDQAVGADGAPLATVTGAFIGTPAYMAPELFDGAGATAASDQFAYCVSAWELLYGVRPFVGATLGELRAALDRPVVARRGRVGRALARGLARSPDARFPSIEALLAVLDRRRPIWVVPGALAATASICLTVGIVAARSHDAPDPCAPPVGELATFWSPAQRAAIAGAFHGAPRGDAMFARIAPSLDRAGAGWLDARREACVATEVGHAQSPALLDRRIACLRDWRLQFAAVTDALAHATPEVVERAAATVADLPSLARCADVAELAAGPALPDDPAVRARIELLYQRLAEVRALHVSGRYAEASALADQIAGDADAARYAPLAIEAALWQADVQTAAVHLDEARAAARQAFDLAVAITDRRSAARAATDLALLGAYDPRRIDDSLQWVRTGRSLLAKLDNASELDARLANAEGNDLLAAGQSAAAQPALERAIAGFRRLDPDHPDLGASLAALGSAELDRGQVESAERDLRDALAKIERDLGPDHPDVATALINLAFVQTARGHYVDATATLDRALELQLRVLGPDHTHVAYGYLARAGVELLHPDHAGAERDFLAAERIAVAAFGPTHPGTAQVEMAYAELLAIDGRGADAVKRATAARDVLVGVDPLTAALADATLARALAADGQGRAALERARSAAAGADTVKVGPGAIRGLIYEVVGEIELAGAAPEAAATLRAAIAAFTTGAPEPTRLAQARLALARAILATDRAGAITAARDALTGFPRDGDPVLRAAISRWLDANSR